MLTIQERIQQARWALQDAGSTAPPEPADPRVDLLHAAVDKLVMVVEALAKQVQQRGGA